MEASLLQIVIFFDLAEPETKCTIYDNDEHVVYVHTITLVYFITLMSMCLN